MAADTAACLGLFDGNCPEFFAPNERADYAAFLGSRPAGYELCLVDGRVAGAFGLADDGLGCKRLNWILLDPGSQGMGIGSAIMRRVEALSHASGSALVRIAASHKSAPFFARFGAVVLATMPDGWGPGMHRVDMEWRP
ncbi:MAG TPA: GNAT family N-acetyltransferase [Rhodanobacter sp.]|nr:GNAT family N-acetyltransferase [Rhodanobacter sp.]